MPASQRPSRTNRSGSGALCVFLASASLWMAMPRAKAAAPPPKPKLPDNRAPRTLRLAEYLDPRVEATRKEMMPSSVDLSALRSAPSSGHPTSTCRRREENPTGVLIASESAQYIRTVVSSLFSHSRLWEPSDFEPKQRCCSTCPWGHRPGARAERLHGYRCGRLRDLTRLCLRPTTRVHRAPSLFIAHNRCRDRSQIYVSSGSGHAFTREAVASLPELADRGPLVMVVDAFLMRAPDDAVGHGDGRSPLLHDRARPCGAPPPNRTGLNRVLGLEAL
jgi:hypothetical protein